MLEFDGSTWIVNRNEGTRSRVYCLAVFNGELYAGFGSGAGYGDIFKYDGTAWTLNFNGGQEQIRSLAVYNGKLYAGQGSGDGDGDILVGDPTLTGDPDVMDSTD